MKIVLTALVMVVLLLMPWRLVALAGDVLVSGPGYTRVSSDTDAYWKALDLEGRLISLGWEVSYRSNLSIGGQPVYGMTSPTTHQIMIDSSLRWNARYAVLAHEGGHTMQPAWVDREQGEAFAESVAAIVVGDSLSEHARYMAAFKGSFLLMVLSESSAIYHAAAVLGDK